MINSQNILNGVKQSFPKDQEQETLYTLTTFTQYCTGKSSHSTQTRKNAFKLVRKK